MYLFIFIYHSFELFKLFRRFACSDALYLCFVIFFLVLKHFKCAQVLRVVKTRQATYAVLNQLSHYVHNLEEIGLLEEKEMIHLHDAVQVISLL